MLMELEKSHNLPFASWRPRKAGGIRSGKEGRKGQRLEPVL